jgi:formylglycine-generating enzyme required for sulfatase activity
MKIFLSYASEDRKIAEELSLALAHEGHDVFFDRDDLPAGDDFHSRIRRGIESSDLVVFLLSPYALDTGSYTITEIDIAQRTWPRPSGRVLPVLLRPVDLSQVPNYLKAVTLLETRGNLTATVVEAVHRIARARRRAWLAKLSAAAAAVALLAVGVAVYVWPPAGGRETTGKDGAPALLVPEGVFTMGDDENAPKREIYIDPFYIDQFEVTVSRYARFLKATGSVNPPEDWEEIDVHRAAELPIVGISWHDALAYCRWAGKRLPTEAEWEKAARGTDARLYPWGNESPDLSRANFSNTSPKAYDGGLSPVGAHPAGRSPFGVHDLAGNAAEWVADWYAESFPRVDRRNPAGPQSGTKKVVRGGDRFDGSDRIAATRRYFADPDHRSEQIGFRCAK